MSWVVLFSILVALLSFGVKIAGMVIAVLRRNQHPRVAKFAAIGLSLMLIAQVGRVLLAMVVSQFVSPDEFLQYSSLIQILAALVDFVGWVFLFVALFGSHMNLQDGNLSNRRFGEITADSDDQSPSETGNPYQPPA